MTVLEATGQTISNIEERSRYSHRELAKTISREDNKEQLILITNNGRLHVDPFWNVPGDIEGDLYRDYMKTHVDFILCARESVVTHLQQAANALPEGWRLTVKAAFRPMEVQIAAIAKVSEVIQAEHLDWSQQRVLDYTRTFVSDPRVIAPPHCTGGAVDIDVIDVDGMPIDMGCPPNTTDERAFTYYDKLTDSQRDNRKSLLEAMHTAGFANLAHEWWHFSYGDQYWAAFYSKPATLYDVTQ